MDVYISGKISGKTQQEAANPADSKASVTSVTGNDSLEVGENTVSVVVTAEDGSTSKYNIVVTRRAEDDPENADKQDNWKKFDICLLYTSYQSAWYIV